MDWTSGYVAEVDYTYGYYHELNPNRMTFSLLQNGITPPKVRNACELGFGQGVTFSINSTDPSVRWYGIDFNPSQVLHAKELVKYTGNNSIVLDDDFNKFESRKDLPEFDYIILHGIWSWISNENRNTILQIIKERLAVGGVVYNSYNVSPGWSAMMPLRDMLAYQVDQNFPKSTVITDKIAAALDFAGELVSASPKFSALNPQVVKRLEDMNKQDRSYLAHEYFNADWRPMNFSSVNAMFSSAKLSFAGSANQLKSIEHLNFTKEQIKLLSGIDDPIFLEMVKDLMVNETFRKDYWIKGVNRIGRKRCMEELAKTKFSLVVPRTLVKMEVTGHLGTAQLIPDIYNPILDQLDQCVSISLSQIIDKLGDKLGDIQIFDAVKILLAKNYIAIAASDQDTKSISKSTKGFNAHLMNESKTNSKIDYLVSPITVSGIHLNRFERLFVLAISNGQDTPEQIADFAWKILSEQGQKLIKDGVTLEEPDKNLTYLRDMAADFLTLYLKLLKKMKVIL